MEPAIPEDESPELAAAPAAEAPAEEPAKAPKKLNRKSLSEVWGKGVSLAKQFILEKTGNTQVLEENKEFQDLVKQFNVNKHELGEAAVGAEALYQAEVATTEAERQFSSALAKLGSHSKANAEASKTVQAFVPYNLQLQSRRTKHSTKFKELLLDPLKSVIGNEVAKVTALLKQLEVERLEYSARIRQLAKNGDGKPDDNKEKIAAQERLAAATLSYEKCKKDVAAVCGVIESRKNALLHGQLLEYTKALYGYFDGSVKCINEKMQTQLALSEEDGEDAKSAE